MNESRRFLAATIVSMARFTSGYYRVFSIMKIASNTRLLISAVLVSAVLGVPIAAKAVGPSSHANAHASKTTTQSCRCTIWKIGGHCKWTF